MLSTLWYEVDFQSDLVCPILYSCESSVCLSVFFIGKTTEVGKRSLVVAVIVSVWRLWRLCRRFVTLTN